MCFILSLFNQIGLLSMACLVNFFVLIFSLTQNVGVSRLFQNGHSPPSETSLNYQRRTQSEWCLN